MNRLAKLSTALALCALGTSAAHALTIELNPVADTFVAFRSGNAANGNNFGTSAELDLHQQGDIYMYAYVRFDLSAVVPDGSTINSISISFTKTSNTVESGYPLVSARNDSLVTGRFALYGLLDVAGNTEQTWGETTLTANAVGSERIASSGQQFDIATRTYSFDGVNESVSGGTTATVTGASDALITQFLQARLDASTNGGLATFIVDFPGTSAGNGFAFASREAASGFPVLTIDYTPGAIPEPSAFAAIAGALGLGFAASRRRRAA